MGGFQGPYGGAISLLENNHDGIFIKQKFDVLEAFTGWEQENLYGVYEGRDDPNHRGGRQIFTCKESSSTCARQCTSAACRPFEMRVFNNLSPSQDLVFNMVRECTCTFCCCNRPELCVYYVENNANQLIGKVIDSWDCCNYSFQVYDANNNVRYSIKANCCQCGLCCSCPCDACEKVQFEVWSGDYERLDSTFYKLGQGFAKNMFGTSDNFSVPFPAGATWQDKALLMASILMIDFMMFESKSSDSHNRRRGHGFGGY